MSRIRLFRLLHLRQLSRQPLRAVLAALAVAAGVALSVTSGLLVTSLDGSIRDVLRALGGPAPLRVIGPMDGGGLDDAVAERVAEVQGVDAIVPAIHAVVIGERRDGREIHFLGVGVDCRIEALVGAFGCDEGSFRAPHPNAPVLMSAVLKRELGGRPIVRTDIGRFPLTGVTVNDSLDDTNRGRVAVFALPTAQRLFSREDRFDTLYVRPEDGADVEALRHRIQRVVGDWNTVLRRDDLPPSQVGGDPLLPLLAFGSAISLGLSGLLVYNIVSLSLEERRRDLAVAGAVGASPHTVTAGVLFEALLLGVAGGSIGALGGVGFAHRAVSTVSSVVSEQGIGIRLAMHVSIWVLVAGLLLGMVTAVVAGWIPARRIRRLDLAGELHGRAAHSEETKARVRMRFAVLSAGAAGSVGLSYLAQSDGAIERWQPPVGTLALAGTALFVFAAVGAAAPLLVELLQRGLRRTSGPLRLSLANLVSRPRRTSVIAAAVGAAVGLGCMLGAAIPAIRSGVKVSKVAGDRVRASTLPTNVAGASARVSPKVLDALVSLPGVASVDRHYQVEVADNRGPLAMTAYEGTRAWPFDVVAGKAGPDVLERGDAILGISAARSRGLRPGSLLRVPTPNGFASIRVAGIWAGATNNGYSATISPGLFERLFGPEPSEEVFLRPVPGVSPAQLAARVADARLDPDLYALTPEQYTTQLASEVGDQVAPFWTLQRMMLFVALVGTLSTLLLIGVQRRRELGVLGAVGFAPSGLARMTIGEAALAGVAGSLLGAVGSLALFEGFRNVAVVAVGNRPPFTFDPISAVVTTAVGIVVVTVGGLLPAWRTSRLPIVEAIRDE